MVKKCEECGGDLEKGVHSSARPCCSKSKEAAEIERTKELLESTIAMHDHRLEQVRRLREFVQKLAAFVAEIEDDPVKHGFDMSVRAEIFLKEIGGYEQ